MILVQLDMYVQKITKTCCCCNSNNYGNFHINFFILVQDYMNIQRWKKIFDKKHLSLRFCVLFWLCCINNVSAMFLFSLLNSMTPSWRIVVYELSLTLHIPYQLLNFPKSCSIILGLLRPRLPWGFQSRDY